jgi:hypothetical protein
MLRCIAEVKEDFKVMQYEFKALCFMCVPRPRALHTWPPTWAHQWAPRALMRILFLWKRVKQSSSVDRSL